MCTLSLTEIYLGSSACFQIPPPGIAPREATVLDSNPTTCASIYTVEEVYYMTRGVRRGEGSVRGPEREARQREVCVCVFFILPLFQEPRLRQSWHTLLLSSPVCGSKVDKDREQDKEGQFRGRYVRWGRLDQWNNSPPFHLYVCLRYRQK